MTSAAGSPNYSSPVLEVLCESSLKSGSEGLLAGDRGLEAGLVVEPLHDVVDGVHVVVSVEAEPDSTARASPSLRHQRRSCPSSIGATSLRRPLAVVRSAAHDAPWPRRATFVPLGADDDDLAVERSCSPGLRERPVEQVVGALRLRLARQLDIGRQHVTEEDRDRRDGATIDHPGAIGPRWRARARRASRRAARRPGACVSLARHARAF